MTQVAPAAEASRPDWDVPDPGYPVRDRVALYALIVVPALLVALVVAVLTGWWWLGGVLLALWGAKTFADVKLRDAVMLRKLGARALGSEEGARLRNIANGLAADLGVPQPELLVIPEGGPNAWIRASGRGGVLAVTASSLDTYTRTELEAMVAHCLTRIHGPDFVYSNLAARWSDLGAGLAPRIGHPHDVRAVALTRYPPGLVSAIQKADGRIRRYAPLWFAADAPSHAPAAERVSALGDL
jgi:hypothetical protein